MAQRRVESIPAFEPRDFFGAMLRTGRQAQEHATLGDWRRILAVAPRVPRLGQGGVARVCGAVGEDDEGGLPIPGTGGLRGTGVDTRLRQAKANGARPEPDAAAGPR